MKDANDVLAARMMNHFINSALMAADNANERKKASFTVCTPIHTAEKPAHVLLLR